MDDSGNRPKKRWAFLSEDLLRHPLSSMLIGFVLTGVVGTFLTNHFAELRQQEARAIEQRDARRKAVLEVSRLFSERLGRAEALSVAIEARASQELLARLKQQYDDADMRALVVRQEGILLMREAMLENDFESLRAEIDGRLVTKRMQPLRECLDRAGGRALAGADGAAVLRECRAAQLLTESRACGDVVSDALYDLASLPAAKAADPMHTRRRYAPRIRTGSHRRALDPAVQAVSALQRLGSRARRPYGPALRGVSFTLSRSAWRFLTCASSRRVRDRARHR